MLRSPSLSLPAPWIVPIEVEYRYIIKIEPPISRSYMKIKMHQAVLSPKWLIRYTTKNVYKKAVKTDRYIVTYDPKKSLKKCP